MSTLSTHVLDTALGRPAQGIRVTLERDDALLGSGVTDADGRVRDLVANDADGKGAQLSEGDYQLTFYVGEYLSAGGRDSFYRVILIQFRIAEGEDHYHVPLLLSPFGYSTYRGS